MEKYARSIHIGNIYYAVIDLPASHYSRFSDLNPQKKKKKNRYMI